MPRSFPTRCGPWQSCLSMLKVIHLVVCRHMKRHVCSTLGSFGTVAYAAGYRPKDDYVDRLIKAFIGKLDLVPGRVGSELTKDDAPNAQALSNSLWALAKLKEVKGEELQMFRDSAPSLVALLKVRGWPCACSFVYIKLLPVLCCDGRALVQFTWYVQALLQGNILTARLHTFKDQELANTAWSLYRLGEYHPHVMEAIAVHAAGQISSFNEQGLANTALAFAGLNHASDQLTCALAIGEWAACKRYFHTLYSLNHQVQLSYSLLCSLHCCADFKRRLQQQPCALNTQAMCNMLWSLAVLDAMSSSQVRLMCHARIVSGC
jgi:hypothetical protein